MNESPHILVVDDHQEIRDLLSKYLTKNGMRVTAVDGGAAMKRALQASAADLVVLDVMMPGEDGLSLCRHLRETVDLPVILLTAMAEETDRVVGLEIGADDYVTKPFNPRELLARIKSVIRRSQSLPKQRGVIADKSFQFDRWTLRIGQRELVDEDGVLTPLSNGEYLLLTAFLERPNMVLSREQLLDLTRGRSPDVFDRSIDNQVSRLRKKIEEDPKKPKILKTVWGGGYQFVAPVKKT
jgi:two-component system OmpR family response regulator